MLLHLLDLLDRQEGQHLQALDDVGIADISPVLEEIVGRGLFGIEPDGALFGLAHLLALGIEQQGNGHRVGVFAELLADQLRAAEHIRPLVVAAELHVAAVILIELVEIVALHDHVVEFEEGQTALPALLVALKGEHLVDREAGADLAQHIDIVELQEPVAVVDHERLAVGKVDEAAHLLFEALTVVLNGLGREHLAHVGLAGGVTDHAGAAAYQCNRLVAGHLHALHQAERHEVPDMEGIGGRVKADVKGRLAVVDEVGDLRFVGRLGNQPAAF